MWVFLLWVYTHWAHLQWWTGFLETPCVPDPSCTLPHILSDSLLILTIVKGTSYDLYRLGLTLCWKYHVLSMRCVTFTFGLRPSPMIQHEMRKGALNWEFWESVFPGATLNHWGIMANTSPKWGKSAWAEPHPSPWINSRRICIKQHISWVLLLNHSTNMIFVVHTKLHIYKL